MTTIYMSSSESDGYISNHFYSDKGVQAFHYEADSEGFGATDSDTSFTCDNFGGDITTLEEVLGGLEHELETDSARLLSLAEAYLSAEQVVKVLESVNFFKEQ